MAFVDFGNLGNVDLTNKVLSLVDLFTKIIYKSGPEWQRTSMMKWFMVQQIGLIHPEIISHPKLLYMKNICIFFLAFLGMTGHARAATYLWVGAPGAKYSDPASWASGGMGGIPGPGDAIQFLSGSMNQQKWLVNLDLSPVVGSIFVAPSLEVTLVTSVNTTLTVTGGLSLWGSLIDSTSEDVRFNLVLDGASSGNVSVGTQLIIWRFAGRVPVSSGNGPMLSLNNTKLVIDNNGSLVFTQNSGEIVSSNSSIVFSPGSSYVLENKLNGVIPAATWALARGIDNPKELYVPAPIIQINGNIRTITHAGNTQYGSIYLDLYALSNDLDLLLPNGTVLSEYLNIYNTNGHTITLLDAAGADSAVLKIPGSSRLTYGGGFNLSGATSKVALARAAIPSTSYRLEVRDFNQSGGNFSLQDANVYTGSSTLTIRRHFNETGGTFLTNSTAAAPASFKVELTGPHYTYNSNYTQITFDAHLLNVAGGIINSPANMVTLKLMDIPFNYSFNQTSPIGAILGNSLQVGRLELSGGPILGGTNILTVTNPAADAVKITAANSYVNGIVRRATNSTVPYMMPTGKGTQLVFNLDTCAVIPASAIASLYQAEYFNTRYTDTMVAAPFRGIDTTQYWNISRVSGTDAQVRLFLPKAVPQAKAADNLVVAHYTGGQWINEQGTVFSPGNAASGSVTSKVLSSFSPFTFGYGAFVNAPLPIHLLSFGGHAENGGARLNWKVAESAARFEVLRSADGVNFSQAGIVQASSIQQQYTYFDGQLLSGNNFYRLRSVEKDGSVNLSEVIMVSSSGQITELITLAPTVVRNTGSLRINAIKDGQMQLVVTDLLGRSWKKLSIVVKAGSSANLINFSDLPAGTYQLSGYMDGKQTAALRFVKQ